MISSHLSALCPVALGLLLVMSSYSASALTWIDQELTCPIDGTKFTAKLAGSGTRFGIYLDLKRFGLIAAPWPLAKCPSNGFVLYKRNFTDEEIGRLRTIVGSPEYQALQATHGNYYLVSKLMASMGQKPADFAYILLQATWKATSKAQYESYASEALEAYKEKFAGSYADPKQWVGDQFLAGELERRLGRLEQAKARFLALVSRDEVKSGLFQDMLELQLRLIDSGNTQPARLPTKGDGKK